MTKKTDKNSKTFLVGRNAKTGQFTSVKYATRHPSSTVVEKVPKAGYGDTKPGKGSGKNKPGTDNTGPRKR